MKTILPGAAIGLLGGGENSLMLALAAVRMGYRVHVCSPDAGPAAELAHVFVRSSYEDLDRIRDFAASVAIVTITDSAVPVLAMRAAEGNCAVLPDAATLEKIENGLETRPETRPETTPPTDSDETVSGETISGAHFLAEFLVIAARGFEGAFVSYPPVTMEKTEGRFHAAQMPAAIRTRIARQAAALTRDMLEDLDFTGTACVEFRLTRQQELLPGDVIPHPHPAGQLTADACLTSQYEQHLRAICGLPLGSTSLLRPAAMAYIPESAWLDGEPDWAAALALPNVKLCLYGNNHGYLAATAASATAARQTVRAARTALMQKRV